MPEQIIFAHQLKLLRFTHVSSNRNYYYFWICEGVISITVVQDLVNIIVTQCVVGIVSSEFCK